MSQTSGRHRIDNSLDSTSFFLLISCVFWPLSYLHNGALFMGYYSFSHSRRFEDLDLFQNDAYFTFSSLFITWLGLYQKGLENDSLNMIF